VSDPQTRATGRIACATQETAAAEVGFPTQDQGRETETKHGGAMAGFWAVFIVPLIAIILIWINLLTRDRSELRHITVLLAMIFATASPLYALWGFSFHLHELQARSSRDFGFEVNGWLISLVGLLASVVWLAVTRNWKPGVVLIISLWTFMVWMALCIPF
jgi:hypothetical protein